MPLYHQLNAKKMLVCGGTHSEEVNTENEILLGQKKQFIWMTETAVVGNLFCRDIETTWKR